MQSRPGLVAVGAGVAGFLVAGGLVTELVSRWVEFSVFLGIPAGVLVGAIAAVLAHRAVRSTDGGVVAVTVGVAAFGYAVLFLGALRYAVAATRSILTLAAVVASSATVAVVAFLGTWWSRRASEPD